MPRDVHGYYKLLGIPIEASQAEIRQAYRKLAKTYHPDTGYHDRGTHFQSVTEAYETLSDAAQRKFYDTLGVQESVDPPPEAKQQRPRAEPIRCEDCNRYTAQPRRLTFWNVTSFVLATSKNPVQKIFCHECARKSQWRSTLWTAALGWWGVPWGPIWTTAHGLGNAFGGGREPDFDEAMLCQNAVAFASRGEGEIAVGLSNVLRKSKNSAYAAQAADIIRFFEARGVRASTEIKDVWVRSTSRTVALATLALSVPLIILTIVLISNAGFGSSASTAQPVSPAYNPSDTDTGSVQSLSSPPAVVKAAETCERTVESGATFKDRRPQAKGHHLTIENGTAGNAIVKLRDNIGRLLVSFYVSRGENVNIDRIPDGEYRIQYALGDALNKKCRRFVDPSFVGQFDQTDSLQTRTEEVFDGTNVIRSHLTYTLYAVPGGDVRTAAIDPAAFDAL